MKKIIPNNLFPGSIAIILGIILLIVALGDWIPKNCIVIAVCMIAAGILFVVFSVLQLRGVLLIPELSDERVLKIRAHIFMKGLPVFIYGHMYSRYSQPFRDSYHELSGCYHDTGLYHGTECFSLLRVLRQAR